MYHYDVKIALEELQEEALLPHPVKLRDMILRHKLGPQDAQLLNHDFQDYLTRCGEILADEDEAAGLAAFCNIGGRSRTCRASARKSIFGARRLPRRTHRRAA